MNIRFQRIFMRPRNTRGNQTTVILIIIIAYWWFYKDYKIIHHTTEESADADMLNLAVMRETQTQTKTENSALDFSDILELVKDLKPDIDYSGPTTTKNYIEILQRSYPNVPFKYWHKHSNKPPAINDTCAKYTHLLDVNFNNIYWQTLNANAYDCTYYLYGAYFDNRTLLNNRPSVYIFSVIDKDKPRKAFCQLWYDNYSKPVIAPVTKAELPWMSGYLDKVWYIPFLLTCEIPPEYHYLGVPEVASLVEKPCDHPSNTLKVINNLPSSGTKKGFAVCCDSLDYFPDDDYSVRLVEWLELLIILGADKVYLYDLAIPKNMTKVLDYYIEKGFVELTPITFPGKLPNHPIFRHMFINTRYIHGWLQEHTSINDCLLKNIHRYKYVTFIDIDQAIIPINSMTWPELLEFLADKSNKENVTSPASYVGLNGFISSTLVEGKYSEFPGYMHMLQHVYRDPFDKNLERGAKCFHDTEQVKLVDHHVASHCIGKSRHCKKYDIDPKDAYLYHWRSNTNIHKIQREKGLAGLKEHLIRDTNVWKYKDPLVYRVTKVLLELGFLKI